MAAAKMLKKRESDLKGTITLLFQPAEEGGAGTGLLLPDCLQKQTGMGANHPGIFNLPAEGGSPIFIVAF